MQNLPHGKAARGFSLLYDILVCLIRARNRATRKKKKKKKKKKQVEPHGEHTHIAVRSAAHRGARPSLAGGGGGKRRGEVEISRGRGHTRRAKKVSSLLSRGRLRSSSSVEFACMPARKKGGPRRARRGELFKARISAALQRATYAALGRGREREREGRDFSRAHLREFNFAAENFNLAARPGCSAAARPVGCEKCVGEVAWGNLKFDSWR